MVPLKPSHKNIRNIQLHPVERLIQAAVQLRFRELRCMDFEDNDERRRRRHPLCQYTRLKQYVVHPSVMYSRLTRTGWQLIPILSANKSQ